MRHDFKREKQVNTQEEASKTKLDSSSTSGFVWYVFPMLCYAQALCGCDTRNAREFQTTSAGHCVDESQARIFFFISSGSDCVLFSFFLLAIKATRITRETLCEFWGMRFVFCFFLCLAIFSVLSQQHQQQKIWAWQVVVVSDTTNNDLANIKLCVLVQSWWRQRERARRQQWIVWVPDPIQIASWQIEKSFESRKRSFSCSSKFAHCRWSHTAASSRREFLYWHRSVSSQHIR